MSSKNLNTYEIEVTDTFGGEANYCWARRYTFKARTIRGAINMLAKEYSSGWRKDFDNGDFARYNLTGACVCWLMIVPFARLV